LWAVDGKDRRGRAPRIVEWRCGEMHLRRGGGVTFWCDSARFFQSWFLTRGKDSNSVSFECLSAGALITLRVNSVDPLLGDAGI
jgi:hypothetical protein